MPSPETSPLTPELEAHIRKTQGGALLFKALLAELDACRAERDEQVYAVQKFLAASRHDLCHENRDELAHAFGLPSREYPCLPPEGEFALRCVEYRQQLYGADGPGSEAEVFAAEVARLALALDQARGVLRGVEWAGSADSMACCPACAAPAEERHRPDCPLARALSGPDSTQGNPPDPSAAPASDGPPSGP